jgi:hypothetical protein
LIFLRSEKKSPGWGYVVVGLIFCGFSLVGFSGMLGFIPDTGRAATLTVIGMPVGVVAIIIGIVILSRDRRGQRPRSDGDWRAEFAALTGSSP